MKKICTSFFLLILLFSCSKKGETPGNYFYYNEISQIKSLDPAYARDLAHMWIVSQMFNTLVELDDSLKIVPSLAKRWDVDPSGKIYTFYLRNDVLFHQTPFHPDKELCSVHDVLFTFQRLANPRTASPGRWVTVPIDTLPDGKLFIEIINDSIIRFHLKKPFTPFLYYLTLPYTSIVPAKYVEKMGKDFAFWPIGTGPFYLKIWKPDQQLVLKKNPLYFEKDSAGNFLPYLEGISIRFIQDKQVAFMEFIREGFDFISGFDPMLNFILFDENGFLKEKFRQKWYVQRFPFLNVEYLGMNVTQPPFDKREVRQAMNYAIDKEKLVFYVRHGVGIPAHGGIVPPALLPTGLSHNPYNLSKAKELLKKAGYDELHPFPNLTLYTTSSSAELAEFIQNELMKISIPVQVEIVPTATLREMMYQGKALFFRASWIADYPDAGTYFSLFYSKNKTPYGPNYTFFENRTYDELFEKSLSIYDESLKRQYYSQMLQILNDEMPAIPLYYDESIRLVSRNIKGLTCNSFNLLKLKKVKKIL